MADRDLSSAEREAMGAVIDSVRRTPPPRSVEIYGRAIWRAAIAYAEQHPNGSASSSSRMRQRHVEQQARIDELKAARVKGLEAYRAMDRYLTEQVQRAEQAERERDQASRDLGEIVAADCESAQKLRERLCAALGVAAQPVGPDNLTGALLERLLAMPEKIDVAEQQQAKLTEERDTAQHVTRKYGEQLWEAEGERGKLEQQQAKLRDATQRLIRAVERRTDPGGTDELDCAKEAARAALAATTEGPA